MVEDEARAPPLQREGCEQQEIGRVARMDDVERAVSCEPPDETRGSPDRLGVFACIPKRSAARRKEREAMDLDALNPGERLRVPLMPLWTHNGDVVAGCA